MTWTSAQKRFVSDNGFLGRDVRNLRMLALSLRDSSLFRRVVSTCWCALFLGRMILSIPRGYPLSLGRYRRGVLHGYAGVGAEFLDLFEDASASIDVVA